MEKKILVAKEITSDGVRETRHFENVDAMVKFYNKRNETLSPMNVATLNPDTSVFNVIGEEPAAGSKNVSLSVTIVTLITK